MELIKKTPYSEEDIVDTPESLLDFVNILQEELVKQKVYTRDIFSRD